MAGYFLLAGPILAAALEISGHVVDLQGAPVVGAIVTLVTCDRHHTIRGLTDREGHFHFEIESSASCSVEVSSVGFHPMSRIVHPGEVDLEIQLNPRIARTDTVVVTADVNQIDVLSPDPAEKVFVRQDLIDANPGRPGAPVSIPGYPVETASGGIKAPQYFAPGVAGDHGEPIAQYLAVGSYLVPNNLSANAHGNGYADPNIFIPGVLESVQVDGEAFNVLEGNHSVNVAAIYSLRSRLDPFFTVTGDSRDLDLAGGFSPATNSLLAIEASFGNGFLNRLEHRQQYKLNTQRIFKPGNHELTLLGFGYYGSSFVAGLVPIFPLNAGDLAFPNIGDTIDPRQRDQTHSALIAVSDTWHLASNQDLRISGFFRTYNLALFSYFGQGIIRQSEFRTVAGQSTNYLNKFTEAFSLLAGLDSQREAPRRDNLDHYGFYASGNSSDGPFTKTTSNNVTLTSITPYAAGSGSLSKYVRYYLGWRRDQIDIQNEDVLHVNNSFQRWVGVNSPKATISFLPNAGWYLPLVSVSFGQAFFTEDPRIGNGTSAGTSVATAHSYQLVLSKTIQTIDFKLTLGHVTTSQELAKIDPDTGLQQDQGPGRLRFLTAAVRRNFSYGSILATVSKADARDVDSGNPTPEAPRTIADFLANLHKLPFGIKAQGEFEYVGRKPLGTGCEPNPNVQCTGTSVRELRAAAVRPFLDQRLDIGVNMLIASGYSGQTIENFYPTTTEEVVGVRIPTYASLSVTYRFGRGIRSSNGQR
jgi:hypothetical protein